jgi:hypothetical protein
MRAHIMRTLYDWALRKNVIKRVSPAADKMKAVSINFMWSYNFTGRLTTNRKEPSPHGAKAGTFPVSYRV